MAKTAWYVMLASDGKGTWVVQATLDDYRKSQGHDPDQAGVPGQTNAGFPTEAAAQAAEKQYDQAHGLKSNGTIGPGADLPKASNPIDNLSEALKGLSDVGAALGAFIAELENWRMWRSLGWLLLGVVLLFGGTALMVYGTFNPVKALNRTVGA